MSSQRLLLNRVVLPLALALAVLAPRDASAQSGNDQAVQSAAKSGVYRDLTANESRMAATRQDKAEITAAIDKANALLGRASPAVREWVQEEARRQTHGEPSALAAEAAARERFGGDLSGMDVEALVQLVMFQAAQQAEQELRDQIAQMRAANQQKRAQREAAQKMHKDQAASRDAIHAEYAHAETSGSRADLDANDASDKDDIDSLGDLTEMQQLRLQVYMDRRQKAYEMLSNVMKKQSDMQDTIIGNLK